MGNQFSLLYAEPSFFGGIARAFDIGDTLTEYNQAETGAQADFQALRSDWRAIAADFGNAVADAYPQESDPPKSS